MLNKRLLSLVPDVFKYVSRIVFFQWLCLLCSIFTTISICFFINLTLTVRFDAAAALCVLIICLMLAAAKSFFTSLHIKTAAALSQNAKLTLRQKVFSHLSKLGASYSSLVSTAEAVQVSVEGIDQLESYFGAYLPQLFYAVAAPVTLFAVISFLNINAAVILLVCVPLTPLSIIAVQKFAKKLLSKYWTAYTDLGDSFLENIQGLTTLKIYEADGEKHREMNQRAEAFRKATMRVLVMQLNSISVMDIVAYGGAAAGIISMLFCMKGGTVTLLQGIIIILLSAEFFIPMRMLGSFFHVAMNGTAAAEKIFRIIDTPVPKKGSGKISGGTTVTIKNLTFGYDDDKTILNNISAETNAAGLYSFVGKSGCGKSTIAALLTGRLKRFDGEIYIGGTPINNISEYELMKSVTLINHNSCIFKGTVESNLKQGNPSATHLQMENALKTADIAELKLNDAVSEQGANLSGGQRQRLALARAILHDSPIYIFDEATSNIDAESEEAIMNAVHRLAEKKLVLLISHRLANVTKSQKIFVLNSRKIEETGTHSELMKADGLYANLYKKQMEYENFGKGAAENEK